MPLHNGGANDPAVPSAKIDGLRISPEGEGRADKLLVGDPKEKKLLEYVTGGADAMARGGVENNHWTDVEPPPPPPPPGGLLRTSTRPTSNPLLLRTLHVSV